ncbi:hypothetical protein ACX0G7_09400 [Flavitalea antarctica]
MKKLSVIAGLLIILAACGHRFEGPGETTSIDKIQEESGMLSNGASLASSLEPQPVKHTGLRHFHKKKYE